MMKSDWRYAVLVFFSIIHQHAEAQTPISTSQATQAPTENDPRDQSTTYLLIGAALLGVAVLTSLAICVSFWVWQNRRRNARRVLRTRYKVKAAEQPKRPPPVQDMFLASSASPRNGVINWSSRSDEGAVPLPHRAALVGGLAGDKEPPRPAGRKRRSRRGREMGKLSVSGNNTEAMAPVKDVESNVPVAIMPDIDEDVATGDYDDEFTAKPSNGAGETLNNGYDTHIEFEGLSQYLGQE